LWGDVLGTIVIGRILVIKSLQLKLELPLAFTSSFNLSTLGGQLGLLLLLLLLRTRPTLLLFRLLKLALLHLLLKSLEASLGSFALLCELIFLLAFFFPEVLVSMSFSIALGVHLLHALGLGFLSLLLLPQSLLRNLMLCPLRFGFSLLCVVLCDVDLVLSGNWRRRSWLLTDSLCRGWRCRGLPFKSPLPLLFAAGVFLFSCPELILTLFLLTLRTLLRGLTSLRWRTETQCSQAFGHALLSLLLNKCSSLCWCLVRSCAARRRCRSRGLGGASGTLITRGRLGLVGS
jgi:hypothetical protein